MEKDLIHSPCIRCCTLNSQDVCVGCGRTLEEIKQWQNYSENEKTEKMLQAEKRLSDARFH